jgi:hypothetical protein
MAPSTRPPREGGPRLTPHPDRLPGSDRSAGRLDAHATPRHQPVRLHRRRDRRALRRGDGCAASRGRRLGRRAAAGAQQPASAAGLGAHRLHVLAISIVGPALIADGASAVALIFLHLVTAVVVMTGFARTLPAGGQNDRTERRRPVEPAYAGRVRRGLRQALRRRRSRRIASSPTFEEITGRKPRTYEQWAREHTPRDSAHGWSRRTPEIGRQCRSIARC